MKVVIAGKPYEFELEEVLQDLTGKETVMLEDYLGGWENLRDRVSARSIVVWVWISKRSAGESITLEQIEDMKGLMFGDTVELADVDPPDEAEGASESSPAPSAPTGNPGMPEETLATA